MTVASCWAEGDRWTDGPGARCRRRYICICWDDQSATVRRDAGRSDLFVARQRSHARDRNINCVDDETTTSVDDDVSNSGPQNTSVLLTIYAAADLFTTSATFLRHILSSCGDYSAIQSHSFNGLTFTMVPYWFSSNVLSEHDAIATAFFCRLCISLPDSWQREDQCLLLFSMSKVLSSAMNIGDDRTIALFSHASKMDSTKQDAKTVEEELYRWDFVRVTGETGKPVESVKTELGVAV